MCEFSMSFNLLCGNEWRRSLVANNTVTLSILWRLCAAPPKFTAHFQQHTFRLGSTLFMCLFVHYREASKVGIAGVAGE